MALTLKQNKTYIDNFGNEYTAPYAVIDQCNGNKRKRIQHFVLEIYKDHQALLDGKSPASQVAYDVLGEEFDAWFSASAITADDNQYHQAYSYLTQLLDEDNNPVWGDWQSD